MDEERGNEAAFLFCFCFVFFRCLFVQQLNILDSKLHTLLSAWCDSVCQTAWCVIYLFFFWNVCFVEVFADIITHYFQTQIWSHLSHDILRFFLGNPACANRLFPTEGAENASRDKHSALISDYVTAKMTGRGWRWCLSFFFFPHCYNTAHWLLPVWRRCLSNRRRLHINMPAGFIVQYILTLSSSSILQELVPCVFFFIQPLLKM